jgi:hypothetical protein
VLYLDLYIIVVSTATTVLVNIPRNLFGVPCVSVNHIVIAGCLPIKRIKFDSKLEHEFIQNFKYLQNSFKKMQIDKVRVTASRCCPLAAGYDYMKRAEILVVVCYTTIYVYNCLWLLQ